MIVIAHVIVDVHVNVIAHVIVDVDVDVDVDVIGDALLHRREVRRNILCQGCVAAGGQVRSSTAEGGAVRRFELWRHEHEVGELCRGGRERSVELRRDHYGLAGRGRSRAEHVVGTADHRHEVDALQPRVLRLQRIDRAGDLVGSYSTPAPS